MSTHRLRLPRRLGLAWFQRLAWVAAIAVAAVSLGLAQRPPSRPLSQSQRISALEHRLRCPSCADASVADSTEPSALAIDRYVRAQVRAGATNTAIISYLESRYGQSVLMVPSSSVGTEVLWYAPEVAAAAGTLAAGWLLWRNRRRGERADG